MSLHSHPPDRRRVRLPSGRYATVPANHALDAILSEPTVAPAQSSDPVTPRRDHSPSSGHERQIEHAAELSALRGAVLLILGAGTVGSLMAWFLGWVGFTIHILDDDRVSRSNLHAGRTLYGPADVGRLKVEAIKHIIESAYPQTTVHAHPAHLQEVPDVTLVDLFDRAAAAAIVIDDLPGFRRCNALGYGRTPLIAAGLHAGARSGHLVIAQALTPCLDCCLGLGDRPVGTLHAEPARGDDIARIALAAATACIDVALETVAGHSTGRLNPARNAMTFLNYADPHLSPDGPALVLETAAHRPDCPVCGRFT